MRRRNSITWAQRGALAIAATALLFFGLRANGNTASQVKTSDTSVWLISPTTGTIVQASEQAREVMATVKVGLTGSAQLSAGQLDSSAVVLDRSRGTVGLVNAATLAFDRVTPVGTSKTDLALVTGGNQAYVVDTAAGKLVALDRSTLETIGSADVTPQRPTPAVVDGAGQLWALDAAKGQVINVRSNGQTTRAKLGTADENSQMTLVEGRPVVVEPSSRTVERLNGTDAAVEDRWCLAGEARGPVFVAGSSGNSDPLVYALDAETGDLFTTNLRTGSCVRLQLRAQEDNDASGALGQPVAAGSLLYVPMPAKGEVLVVDGATNHIERSVRALTPADRGHPFELFTDEGRVWFNDLEGPTAGVINRDGIRFLIDKYRSGLDQLADGGAGAGNRLGDSDSGEFVDNDPTKGNVNRKTTNGDGIEGGGEGEGTTAQRRPPGSASPRLDEGDGTGTGATASTNIPEVEPTVDPATLAVLPPGDPAALPKATPSATGSPSVSPIPAGTGPSPDRPTDPRAPSVTPADTLIANFKWDPGGQIDLATVVTFTDTSVGKPTQWVWAFTAPDASSSTANGSQVRRSFDRAGVWTVTLTVSANGRVDTSLPATIVVRDPADTAPPTPDFSWDPPTPIVDQETTFTDRSRGKGVSAWAWDFGDGTVADTQNPKKVWARDGSYVVKLTVSSPHGTTKAEARVTVAAKPQTLRPDFTFALQPPRTGTITAGQPVEFKDASLGAPTSWQWDFGDGTTTSGANVVHAFRDAGDYRVTLSVQNDKGSASATKTVHVERAASPPIARITEPANNTTVEIGQRTRFVSGTTGNVSRQTWAWGDGTRSDGASAEKAWNNAGTYQVTLTASNEVGSTTAVVTITVTPNAPGPIIAGFSVDPGGSPGDPARVGEVVQFTNRSLGEGSFVWDFGDGGTSNLRDPRHIYNTAGRFTAVLRMTSGSRVATFSRDVFIRQSDADIPVADFSFAPAAPSTGVPVGFTDRSRGALASWRWDFGDGSPTSSAQNPTHTYTEAKTYTVVLTVTTRSGSTSAKSLPVTVTPSKLPPPPASILVRTPATDRIVGKSITFEDTTAAARPLTTPVFTFPTGPVTAPAGQRSVQYVFTSAGPATVTMQVCWVEDPTNCGTATASVDIRAAEERPVAAFTLSGQGVIDAEAGRLLTGRPVTFTDTSTGAGITTWTWTVGGQPQAGNRETLTLSGFDRPGRVTVTLTVANGAGASTASRDLEIVDPVPTPQFSATTPVTLGQPTSFTDTSEGYITSWEWHFGDGTTFTTTNPASRSPDHLYATDGTFSVELKVTNPLGNARTITKTVVVNPPAKPSPVIEATILDTGAVVTGTDLRLPAATPIQFSDTTTATSATTWTWSWGDGTPDTAGQRATHVFATTGSFVVKLTATNAGGTTTVQVNVTVVLNLARGNVRTAAL